MKQHGCQRAFSPSPAGPGPSAGILFTHHAFSDQIVRLTSEITCREQSYDLEPLHLLSAFPFDTKRVCVCVPETHSGEHAPDHTSPTSQLTSHTQHPDLCCSSRFHMQTSTHTRQIYEKSCRQERKTGKQEFTGSETQT